MAESLTFFPNKSRLIAYAFGTGIALIVSVLVMLNLEQIMHPYLRLTALFVGFLGCVAFGYGTLYNLMRVAQPQPLLQADSEGLWFHSSIFNHGKVAWPDLQGFEVVKYGLTKKVLIRVQNSFAYVDKYPGIRKLIFRRTMKRYGTPLTLPLSLFSGDVAVSLQQMSAFGKQIQSENVKSSHL